MFISKKLYIATFFLIFTNSLYTSQAITAEQKSSEQQQTVLAEGTTNKGWFNFITAVRSFISDSIIKIKNYFFPPTLEQAPARPLPEKVIPARIMPPRIAPVSQQSIPTTPPSQTTTRSLVVQQNPLPQPYYHLQQNMTRMKPQEQANVVYNCVEKRLELTFNNTSPRYFNFVDAYQWSPQKKYLLATTIETSIKDLIFKGSSTKTITKLIDPRSNNKEIATFNNILMYNFSPEETKLLFLTSDTTIWQTFGITKPSIKHEEPTGIIKKTNNIFTYHIFDLTSNKIIDSFENATGISFNNETEVTVYFEDRITELYRLNTGLTAKLTNIISNPSSSAAPQITHYNPHEKTFFLPQAKSKEIFSDVNMFYFSPHRKYVFIETPSSWAQYMLNTAQNINTKIPSMHLINIDTGEEVSNFKKISNIVCYTFSPEETKILLKIQESNNCSYVLFDIEQNSIIDQPIQSARSVQFRNETTFTLVDAKGQTQNIPINTKQETLYGKIIQQSQESVRSIAKASTEQTIKAYEKAKQIKSAPRSMTQMAKNVLASTRDKGSSIVEKTKTKLSHLLYPIDELEEVIVEPTQEEIDFIQSKHTPYDIEFINQEESEEENNNKNFFESAVEQDINIFKKYILIDGTKAENAYQNIIKEIAQHDAEEARDAQQNLLDEYAKLPQQKKLIFAQMFFKAPDGVLYNEKDKEQNKYTNHSESTVVIIDESILTIKQNNKELFIERVLDIAPQLVHISESGNYIAIAYVTKAQTFLDVFYQTPNRQYTKTTYLIPSIKLIGLRFINDTALFLLNSDYLMASIELETIPYKTSYDKAQNILKEIESLSQSMKESDVNSPEIITDLYNKITELDKVIPLLSEQDKKDVSTQQELLKEQYVPTYSRVMENSLAANWSAQQDTIITIANNVIIPMLSIAILPVLQASTGNIPLNFNSLKIAAFSAIASTNIAVMSNKLLYPTATALITGTGSAMLNDSLVAYTNQPTTIPYPSPVNVLKGAFLSVAATIAKNVFEQNGGVPKLVNEFSHKFAFREAQLTSQNELTAALTPAIKKIITKPEIASFLAEVTYITCEYACIGMGMHMLGLGFSNEADLTTALSFSALRGITYGCANEIIKRSTHRTGALITLPTEQVSSALVNSMIKDIPLNLTPQDAAASLLHGIAIATTDLIVEQSETFQNLINQTSEKLKNTIIMQMPNFYNLWNFEEPRFF